MDRSPVQQDPIKGVELMSRIRVLLFAAGLLASAAALLPLASSADLPKPKSGLIVPFKSMDGVSMGTSKAKVLQKWGAGNGCSIGTGGRDTCVWFATGTTDFPVEAGRTGARSAGWR